MKPTLLIFILLTANYTYTQTISRQVIASTGSIGSGTISSSTTGPSILTTSAFTASVTLTQGFQQPIADVLNVEILTTLPTCDSPFSGSIELLITGCSGNYTVTWNNGEETMLIEDLETGTYTVNVAAGSCSYTGNVTLSIDPDCDSEIPNLITVNGDGSNDYLIIPQLFFPAYQTASVTIINRWGQEVWSTSDYDNSSNYWSGENINGDELPAGTYFYEVKFPQETKQGYLELLR